ncbi:YolD-like family protein [Oceanobacillus massiliensis]|uniref:YolD-like family protein n=1 Tax=Oceanobacillus massiliensis TaxID=1465765 RepID=UPI0002889DC3|nr:YolD-like family protein [Oceanobacillus massiliensis]
MKLNKLTPGSNLLWESSRMMLPEHKEVLQQHQKELHKRKKPILDEQQIELFSHSIGEAMKRNKDVKMQIFNLYEDTYIVGKVKKVSPERDKVLIKCKDRDEWLNFNEILAISLL